MPRLLQDVYHQAAACEAQGLHTGISLSMFELYLDDITDLMAAPGGSSGGSSRLAVRENAGSPYVEGLAEVAAESGGWEEYGQLL